ncbi:MAG TPA: STAS domain-containing protein [Anaerolineae bacterium]|nr:STAS domain-containing protein [Anaerolineae bacterium]
MFTIDIRRTNAPGIHLVILSGEFDLSEKGRVEDYFTKALSMSPRGLIIDLSPVSLLDSSGIGLLVAYHTRLEEAGARMAVVISHNKFLMGKLSRLGIFSDLGIAVYETTEEAEASFS